MTPPFCLSSEGDADEEDEDSSSQLLFNVEGRSPSSLSLTMKTGRSAVGLILVRMLDASTLFGAAGQWKARAPRGANKAVSVTRKQHLIELRFTMFVDTQCIHSWGKGG